MDELLDAMITALRDLDPVLRTLIAGFGMLLETSVFVGLIVPGDTIAIVASLGVGSPAEYGWLILALVLGAVAGESIGFALGRWVGPRLRASKLGQRLGERKWQLADHYLGRRGGPAVFLSRFLPVLHSLIPLTAGMAGMRYRKFLAWTASASIVWAVIVVSLGSGAAAGYDQLAGRVKGAGFIFAGAAAAIVLILWLLKRAFLRRERGHLQVDAAEPHEAAARADALD
ncbi:DedA family protein [Leucobacter luti]|uniref:Membrane protein DedA with SNARE-associated domain n=1 Tax=Leucobacter luti TaxID=340320 RepID=A0A4Q7TWZ7_9MICO|nr:DedA family protein [Leucobacter luti]MBL3698119.1 DedA family protein [Leucobacter luti]RZT64797.1 membrane protein DedA with SNARE-associated domain [Leucobacter luti]